MLQIGVDDAQTFAGGACAPGVRAEERWLNVEPSKLDEAKTIAATYLRSSILYLRMAASHLMREIGGAWAASQLREALEIESDEAVRKVMANDLSSMRQ